MSSNPKATVTLTMTDNFSAGMQRAADAAHSVGVDLALAAATWEPHDWSRF